jgi:acetoin utilization deacetylase AcuC-like enzyme
MRAYYTDRFVLPLPPGHRFPMDKYRLLRERCVAEGVLAPEQLHLPEAASWEALGLVHDRSYLDAVRAGTLAPAAQRRIGFPWSPEMVERSRRSVGGTIGAARDAVLAAARRGWGVGVNLAGGTHHAHAAEGAGFCVFNDAAVAIRVLQQEGLADRALVVDCDVHQGDGTAEIFASDPTVLTFSVHGAGNYPFRKARSTVDVALPDGSGDEIFLAALDLHLPHLLEDFEPELVVYLAGADPLAGDRFGRLALTLEGLAERDRLVLGMCRERGVPVAVAMAGGYARDTGDTVSVHLATVREAARLGALEAPAGAG